MKTDREKLLELFKDFGMSGQVERQVFDQKGETLLYSDIEISGGCCTKVGGYGCCSASFNFDKNDRFINVELWEG